MYICIYIYIYILYDMYIDIHIYIYIYEDPFINLPLASVNRGPAAQPRLRSFFTQIIFRSRMFESKL